METLLEFISVTKYFSYIVAILLMVAAIPFWKYLVQREPKSLPRRDH